MNLPDKMSEILALKRLGMGSTAIAGKLGMRKTTVKRYLRAGGWIEYKTPERPRTLDGLDEWLKGQMRKHVNNAEVIRQELEKEKGLSARRPGRKHGRSARPRSTMSTLSAARVRWEDGGSCGHSKPRGYQERHKLPGSSMSTISRAIALEWNMCCLCCLAMTKIGLPALISRRIRSTSASRTPREPTCLHAWAIPFPSFSGHVLQMMPYIKRRADHARKG